MSKKPEFPPPVMIYEDGHKIALVVLAALVGAVLVLVLGGCL